MDGGVPGLGGAGADVVAGGDVDPVEADAGAGEEHFAPVVGVGGELGGVGWGGAGGVGVRVRGVGVRVGGGERAAVDGDAPVP